MAVIIGAASLFVSEHYGGPAVLFALLIGMAFHFLSEDRRTLAGIHFCSTTVLRWGVGLLGAKITASQLGLLSPALLAMIIGGVFATLLFGAFITRFSKWPLTEGTLAAASTAICGASAAIALAATFNHKQLREQALLAIVVTVTALSTLAMVLYPFISGWCGFDHIDAGIFLGGTIHDVAQVVGAGAMIGPDALEIASLTKMIRVALLIPILIIFMFVFSSKAHRTEEEKAKPWYKNIPMFLLGFIALAALNCTGIIPTNVSNTLGEISRLFILISISALGLKTSLGKLKEVGWTPIVLMSIDTVFLLLWVIIGIFLLRTRFARIESLFFTDPSAGASFSELSAHDRTENPLSRRRPCRCLQAGKDADAPNGNCQRRHRVCTAVAARSDRPTRESGLSSGSRHFRNPDVRAQQGDSFGTESANS